jgi:Methyltransferase domain
MNTLDYLESLEPPLFLSGKSAWVEHIPFVPAIIKMLKPMTFVELGSHHGDSYLAFCQWIHSSKLPTRCFAVDTWAGDEHAAHYGEEVYSHFCSIHNPLYAGFSSLLRMTFDEAATNFADESVDLLHIDGFHTYDAVKQDFNTWRSKLSKHAVVLFHDTNVRERDFGVWKFWAEISSQYPSFEFIHGHGLGVLGVGSNLSSEVSAFFSADDVERKKILLYFSRLGGGLTKGLSQDVLLATARARDRELFEQNAALSNHINTLEHANCLLKAVNNETLAAQTIDRENLRGLAARLEETLHSMHIGKATLLSGLLSNADMPLPELASFVKQQLTASQVEVEMLRLQNSAVAQSSFWRMTYPLRVAAHQAKKSRNFFTSAEKKTPKIIS